MLKLFTLLLLSSVAYAQTVKLDTVFCDCENAKALSVFSKVKYGKTMAPVGFGKINEISPKKQNSPFTFEKEHNSAWYQLQIKANGNLTFTVTPNNANDDYDFMLFKALPKTIFCDSLITHNVKPVRACISNNNTSINGKTGLDATASKEFIKIGKGASFNTTVAVKKGELYYLVLDNVHEGGEGHLLEIELVINTTIKGSVVDENNKPIKAEVLLTNSKGDTVVQKQTDAAGNYQFNANLIQGVDYNLNYYNDSSFVYSKNINTKDTTALTHIHIVLPKLRKGSKYSIGSINFVGGSVRYLPRAIPSMFNLYKLLSKNPQLKIKIIGHSNGRDTFGEKAIIAFTKSRAEAIKSYLVAKGINENRITTDGKGDKEMLFKLPMASGAEQEQNRRVEVFVEEF